MPVRWLVVVGAVMTMALVELLSDTVLDAQLPFPYDMVVVVAIMGVVTLSGAAIAFRRVDTLTSALRNRNAELESSEASMRALHRVSMSLSTLTDLDAQLQAVVDSARLLLRADVAALVLRQADARLRLAASSGPPDAFDHAGDFGGGDFRGFVRQDLRQAHLAAPIQRGAKSVGTLAVGARTPRAYDVRAVETLSSLASQAAIAIENQQLQEQLRELAIRAERERIAREMHDGLAQVLGYVDTKSQAVEELLASGRIDAARIQLDELAAAARSVYVDVREAILGLSSPIEPGHSLGDAVHEYAGSFADASKLVVTVDMSDGARTVRLPPHAEAQSFRILQEALTNVRKHAQARRVCISLDSDDGQLRLRIDDDGRGLSDADDADDSDGWPRYGLASMRERSAAIGGSLELAPLPQGTRVELRVPLTAPQMLT